jgi:hypothetical protein
MGRRVKGVQFDLIAPRHEAASTPVAVAAAMRAYTSVPAREPNGPPDHQGWMATEAHKWVRARRTGDESALRVLRLLSALAQPAQGLSQLLAGGPNCLSGLPARA